MPSERPIVVVRRAWEAVSRDGSAALRRYAHAGVTWAPTVEPGAEVVISASDFEDHGDCIVVAGRMRVYRGNAHHDVPVDWTVEVRDGLIASVQALASRLAAREACAA